MTPEFIAAVIDMLLPGDEVMPRGSAAGVDLDELAAAHSTVLCAIAAQAGGDASFVHTAESLRGTILESVERATPDAFRALLVAVLSNYYEAPSVLTALGWRIDPPQPAGHAVQEPDHVTADQLERVRRQGRIWRAV